MAKATGFIYLLCLAQHKVNCQELEPRAYAALPKDLNAIVFAYGLSKGNVLNDPSRPIKDLSITVNNFGAGYLHTFELGGKLARVQVILPFVLLAGHAELNGRDTSVSRGGFGDARIRFGINLTGTAALGKREFAQYTQKTIIGVSFIMTVPTGLYLKEKLINIGSNRWAFKPEIGVSKRIKRVYVEAYGGVWFYTTNREYLGDNTLGQKPVFSLQAHASYYFKNRMMVSFNTTWFNGGTTSINDRSAGDLLDNWRVGATWAFPIAKQQTIKLQFHVGAYTRTGYDYNVIVLGYQYLF
ncbi:MAG TPA: transporter [Chitinophagaceae bacterium]|nr:transporter [Chitinophagaceae bacterium]